MTALATEILIVPFHAILVEDRPGGQHAFLYGGIAESGDGSRGDREGVRTSSRMSSLVVAPVDDDAIPATRNRRFEG